MLYRKTLHLYCFTCLHKGLPLRTKLHIKSDKVTLFIVFLTIISNNDILDYITPLTGTFII